MGSTIDLKVRIEIAFLNACELGRIKEISLLISQGVDPMCWSGSALVEACEHHRLAVIQVLLKAGATTSDVDSGLSWAVRNRASRIARALINGGGYSDEALVCLSRNGRTSLVKKMLEISGHRIDTDVAREALTQAVLAGKMKTAAVILSYGTNSRDLPSHDLLVQARSLGFKRIASLLEVVRVRAELLMQ